MRKTRGKTFNQVIKSAASTTTDFIMGDRLMDGTPAHPLLPPNPRKRLPVSPDRYPYQQWDVDRPVARGRFDRLQDQPENLPKKPWEYESDVGLSRQAPAYPEDVTTLDPLTLGEARARRRGRSW
jgi:hypothetical protein